MDNWAKDARAKIWLRLFAKLSRGWEQLLSIPSELAIRAANLSFLEQGPTDAVEARRLGLSCASPKLDEHDQIIVDTLLRDGIYVTSLSELGVPGSAKMLDDATRLSRQLTERSQYLAPTGKLSIVASASDILQHVDILRWALAPRILDIVEAYLGESAAYDGTLLYQSRADGRELGIRTWHRDREDDRMLKVAVYLNDVDDDGGPFQVLTPELQRLVNKRATWRYAKFRKDGQSISIRKSHWENGVRTVTGLRGTVILVDSARNHHRGQPPISRDRSAVFHTFFSRRPRHPFYCGRSSLTDRQIAEFAALLPERERACVLWRQQLPWFQRVIPRNRMTI